MTPTAQRRLAVVACCTVTGEPDGTHLSVEEWSPRWQEWLTSMALCGQSAEQGALPTDTVVTCTGCEGRRDHYERALTGRPTAEQEQIASLLGQVDRIRAWASATEHGAAAAEILQLLDQPHQEAP